MELTDNDILLFAHQSDNFNSDEDIYMNSTHDDNPRQTLSVTIQLQKSLSPLNVDEFESLPTLKVSGDLPFKQASGDIELGTSLGMGGMGQVFVAKQLAMDREVAVKRSHAAMGNGTSFRSVVAEGRRFGRLDHPNIPPVHLIGQDEEHRAVLVMKRIEGDNWRSVLDNPDHPRWSQINESRTVHSLRILIQVCHAVEHAHSRDLLHRDLKTENIMVGDFGQVYLIDWGVSIDLRDPSQRLSTSDFVGTPCLAAPEMATPNSSLGPAVDIYLLGGVLYELLTGRVPHPGKTIPEVLKNITKSTHLQFNENTPPELEVICRQALAHKPKDRYASAADFRAAIELYLRHRFILAHLKRAQDTLEEMRQINAHGKMDVESSSHMMNISHKCRFALESVIENDVEVPKATRLLVECVALQVEYAIATGELRVARILMSQLGKMVDQEETRLVDLSKRIKLAVKAKSQTTHNLAKNTGRGA